MNLHRVKDINISKTLEFLSNNAELWEKDTFRQEHPQSPHRKTKAVYVIWPEERTAHAAINTMSAKFDKTLGVLPYSADIIITIMEITKILKKGLARAAFIKLQPGGTITPHIDQGPFAAATERYHLPITTNPDCFLSSGGETAHAPAGELWYFNKHALHTATNGGSTDRVHLIIDVWK